MGLKELGNRILFKKSSTDKRVDDSILMDDLSKQSNASSNLGNPNLQDAILSNEAIFNELIEKLKLQVGESLLSSAILSLELGSAVANYHSDETNDLYLCSMTKFFIEESSQTTYKGNQINDYYAMNLSDNKFCLVLLFGEYCWYMVIDKGKTTIGIMLNVIVPNLIEEFGTTLETIRVLNEQNFLG